MSTLWVSSWNDQIYNISGKHLEQSINNYVNMRFLAFTDESFFKTHQPYINWFNANKDIIPNYFGGNAEPCKCKKPSSRQDSDHKVGCRYNWWNRNVCRWVKKIFILKYVIDNTDFCPSRIIWIDADCIIHKPITEEVLDFIFRYNHIFYFKGSDRKVEETGIVGYHCTSWPFIDKMYNTYMSGEFRNCIRWDDCYIFQKTRKSMPELSYIDWGTIAGKNGDVINDGIFKGYISHNKGTHGRISGIYQ